MPKCPVCQSARVRKGYRPTPLWSKLLFRFNMLCDNCNWEFSGFALPWMLPSKPRKSSRTRKQSAANSAANVLTADKQAENDFADNRAPEKFAESLKSTEQSVIELPERKRIKKRIKFKFDS